MINKKTLETFLNSRIGEFLYPKPNSCNKVKNSFGVNYKKMFFNEIPKLFLPIPGNGYRYGKLLANKNKNFTKEEINEIAVPIETVKWVSYLALYFFIT